MGVLVAAAALVLSAFGPASYADLSGVSPAPPYPSGLGTKFFATANKAWSGARELTPDTSNNPLGKPTGQWDPDTTIWTKTCSTKAQTASFKRTLELPGRPTTSTFFIFASSASGNAFKSFTLSVNGVKAVKGSLAGSGYYGTFTLPARALKAFDDGPNRVVVTVKRGALAGLEKCNTSDADRYGVKFQFLGDFAADLALSDTEQNVVYRKASTSNSQILNITLRNLGPSAAVAGGTFFLRAFGISNFVLLGDLATPLPGTFPTAPPFDDCESTETKPPPGLTVEVTC